MEQLQKSINLLENVVMGLSDQYTIMKFGDGYKILLDTVSMTKESHVDVQNLMPSATIEDAISYSIARGPITAKQSAMYNAQFDASIMLSVDVTAEKDEYLLVAFTESGHKAISYTVIEDSPANAYTTGLSELQENNKYLYETLAACGPIIVIDHTGVVHDKF